jgi:hypothetical protein
MRSGKTLEAFGFTETKKEYANGGTIENKFIYTIGGL